VTDLNRWSNLQSVSFQLGLGNNNAPIDLGADCYHVTLVADENDLSVVPRVGLDLGAPGMS